jgi:hypothetical protein
MLVFGLELEKHFGNKIKTEIKTEIIINGMEQ